MPGPSARRADALAADKVLDDVRAAVLDAARVRRFGRAEVGVHCRQPTARRDVVHPDPAHLDGRVAVAEVEERPARAHRPERPGRDDVHLARRGTHPVRSGDSRELLGGDDHRLAGGDARVDLFPRLGHDVLRDDEAPRPDLLLPGREARRLSRGTTRLRRPASDFALPRVLPAGHGLLRARERSLSPAARGCVPRPLRCSRARGNGGVRPALPGPRTRVGSQGRSSGSLGGHVPRRFRCRLAACAGSL